jgi:pimeloyl-ACP methyl ester carboxylesterase
VLALAAPVAANAQPAPFGHACVAQNGVRFCPTTGDGQRVPTWDGVPIDVDVTLPADGEGPFPTLVMLHGFPGSKSNFESSGPDGVNSTLQHYTIVFYASRGWAARAAGPRPADVPALERQLLGAGGGRRRLPAGARASEPVARDRAAALAVGLGPPYRILPWL